MNRMILALAARALAVLLVGAGCLVLLSCLYLLVLAFASFAHRTRKDLGWPHSNLVVLIPAHNEEKLIGRCLSSLARQTYPKPLRRVVVIADNCTDRTEEAAKSFGADVMVRRDPDAPGKGRALGWAISQLLADTRPPDAFVVIDADSIADPDLLRQLEAQLSAGAEVAQSDYRVLAEGSSPSSRLVAVGFLLFHRTRLTGRSALGLPANLLGNGMAFKREIFERVPWTAFTAVEDLEYSLMLRMAGVHPVFAADAHVEGPLPESRRAIQKQRMRWEGGRLHLLTHWFGPLLWRALQRRDWTLLDSALDLAILPTGLLALTIILGSILAGTGVLTHAAPPLLAFPWLACLIVLTAYVFVGLRAAGAPRSAYRALLGTPVFLGKKAMVYARLMSGFDPYRWDHANGDSDHLHDPDGDGRAWIAGVPVDVLDIKGAVDRVMDLVGQPNGAQVCTVNLDFVVSAQRDPEVTSVLRRSDLNLADGAPVAWLARLRGHRLPRVAGADLVPMVVGAAAERGSPVFFLGGEHNAAEESARRLLAQYPSLAVAGCYEPPRGSVENLPSAEMLRLIRDSGAAIVLVGLGHPKQERWIAQHRTELGSSVAIGVGGCFDFISARRRRAPRWVQELGFEWLFRLLQEPRRLFARYLRDALWLFVLAARILRTRRRPNPAQEAAPAG